MCSVSVEKIYKISRIIIFAVPVFVISLGIYFILFPIENFDYFLNQPENSKFKIEKNEVQNEISFGVFPTLNHQYIDLKIKIDKTENKCLENSPKITLKKTYRAFLYPEGKPIESKDTLKEYLFHLNKSQYPNGSLLHLKTTDEVYLLSNGKKILFPGPEIFHAFGYSFENLTEVEKSTLDQFPDADNRFFSWVQPHPDGTLFQAYPSHKIFLVADGEKHEIENVEILSDLWPKYFLIPVDDINPQEDLTCSLSTKKLKNGKLFCRFDRQQLSSSLGGYYNFTLKYDDSCPVAKIHLKKVAISLASEKSFVTIKDSFRKIFASIINRYFLKQ